MLRLFESFSVRARPWLVIAGCLLIAGAILAVWFLDIPARNWLLLLLVLACPLSHLLMGHGEHNHQAHDDASGPPTTPTGGERLSVSGNN
jgi:hypothetical protein